MTSIERKFDQHDKAGSEGKIIIEGPPRTGNMIDPVSLDIMV